MIKVLFVCLGNICRSPMVEFIFKDMINKKGLSKDFIIKSAATSFEEIGNDIHYGAKDKLIQKNIPFTKRKATRITLEDYKRYDFIIGMEESNIRNIKRIVGEDVDKKINGIYLINTSLINFPPPSTPISVPNNNISKNIIDLLKSRFIFAILSSVSS